ncbi:MAG: aminotransferase class IV [Chloroflexota bacterium]|nr:MAG: aminotransferase class IV [Chloroflexota bacterium]
MEEIVYLNGDLIPRSQAKTSPFDHGLLYGYGAFETMRSYGGTIFRLDHHLARLQHAAETLNIATKLTAFDLKKACPDLLKANNLTDARVRLTVTAGEGDMVPNPDTCKDITVFIAAKKFVPQTPETYQRGYSAILSSNRRNSQSPLSKLKSTSYLENFLARQEARVAGVNEVVLLNEKGFVAEGSATNIFLVSQEMLITPPLESGVLPGITREAVLELAQKMGIIPLVRQVELSELHKADEAFLTSSTIEIMPLTRLDNKPIGSGKPGLLTQRLMSSYKELVAKEIQLRYS